MKLTQQADAKLIERLLLSPRVEGDRLVLADAVLRSALDGGVPLNSAELAALRASPLTLRRFRQLSIERRAAARAPGDEAWSCSAGMLRAAADGADLERLLTDDGHWSLHFVLQDDAWRLILSLDASAPFAARLLREQPILRVVDGSGAILLQGRLDADGEAECGWPFDDAPAAHFQQAGARFAVKPVQPRETP